MTCLVVIPVKPPGQAKGRLAGVLDQAKRAALAEAMLRRVFEAASAAVGKERVVLVGMSRMGLPDDVRLLAEPEGGLNAALGSALGELAAGGATRVVSLAGDLPLLTAGDVSALCDLGEREVGIAPDRHGTGTNALSLPLPVAKDFAYRHGPGSFALHQEEVSRLDLDMHILVTPGLARDVDEVADLEDARALRR